MLKHKPGYTHLDHEITDRENYIIFPEKKILDYLSPNVGKYPYGYHWVDALFTKESLFSKISKKELYDNPKLISGLPGSQHKYCIDIHDIIKQYGEKHISLYCNDEITEILLKYQEVAKKFTKKYPGGIITGSAPLAFYTNKFVPGDIDVFYSDKKNCNFITFDECGYNDYEGCEYIIETKKIKFEDVTFNIIYLPDKDPTETFDIDICKLYWNPELDDPYTNSCNKILNNASKSKGIMPIHFFHNDRRLRLHGYYRCIDRYLKYKRYGFDIALVEE
jgi:hypothetical protein